MSFSISKSFLLTITLSALFVSTALTQQTFIDDLARKIEEVQTQKSQKLQVQGLEAASLKNSTNFTFRECNTSEYFTFDNTTTTVSPQPPSLDNPFIFTYNGTFLKDAEVYSVRVDLRKNNATETVYSSEFYSQKSYKSGDIFTKKIQWYFPSFMSVGRYEAQIQIHDLNGTTNFHCLYMDFQVQNVV